MLISSLLARDLKVELFEATTLEQLQDDLSAWLTTRTEEKVVGLEFDATDASFRAYLLYTE